MEITETKICKKCSEKLPLTKEYFAFSKGYWIGKCRKCQRKYIKAYHLANPEIIARHRETRRKKKAEINRIKKANRIPKPKRIYVPKPKKPKKIKTPEEIEARRLQKNKIAKKWRKNNPEKERLRRKKWRKNNPEKIRLKKKKWREDYPEKAKAKSRRKQQKQRNNVTDVYVKCLIKASTGLKRDEIPKEMIETKRLILKLKRELKTM